MYEKRRYIYTYEKGDNDNLEENLDGGTEYMRKKRIGRECANENRRESRFSSLRGLDGPTGVRMAVNTIRV